MDLRQKKTLSAIRNAFIELRAKKTLEKITVKELTEAAEISKATFYLHYQDVYDLSKALQDEVIESVFNNIEHPEYIINNTSEFTRELFNAFIANKTLTQILFADNQASILPLRIEEKIKNNVLEFYPEYKGNIKLSVLITYEVQGAYYAFGNNASEYDIPELIDVIADLSKAMPMLLQTP